MVDQDKGGILIFGSLVIILSLSYVERPIPAESMLRGNEKM